MISSFVAEESLVYVSGLVTVAPVATTLTLYAVLFTTDAAPMTYVCVGWFAARPIITVSGAGDCENIAAAARYSGVSVAKSAATSRVEPYDRVRSVQVAECDRISGTPKPARAIPTF